MVFVVDRRKALKRLKICWDDCCRWSLELLFAFETSLSKGIKKPVSSVLQLPKKNGTEISEIIGVLVKPFD